MTGGITLWHVPLSHYSEKARWALDFKRVPHTRRAILGGAHPLVCWIVTRGQHHTVPALTIDGRGIGDSTAIIAELERRFPDRPLYPEDPAERRRALALEEHFDEELGPYLRRLAYHEVTSDPAALAELTVKQVPMARKATAAVFAPGVKLFLDSRFGIVDHEKAREAERKMLEALDRLEAELAGREFLAGDAFSVADLTAPSLFYGLVLPPEGPWQPVNIPAPWRERNAALRDRPGVQWVARMYARHRLPSAGRVSAPDAEPATA
jgi:glutathione S-transferase